MPISANNHYPLKPKQLDLLRLLYRFRFATSQHLANSLNIKSDTINQRLQVLLEQEYIARHYDGQYKIHGLPAEYYLIENGIKALKQYVGDKCDNKVLHNLLHDKDAKPPFIAHSLNVFMVFCSLKERYGDGLRFFTKSQIYASKHFPKQRPDALIRLKVGSQWNEFFLEVIDPTKPLFATVGKVRRYIEYADDETWYEAMGTKLPTILAVTDMVGNEIRFQKQANRFLKNHYKDEPKIFTTNIGKLEIISSGRERIWRDVEERDQIVSLPEIG